MITTEKETTTGRMDADILVGVARALDCIALQTAAEKRARILEKAFLRRARETYALSQPQLAPREPMALSTIWRASGKPRLVHWVVAGIGIVGDYLVHDDREFVACGAEVRGCHVGDETRWGRGTMKSDPINCLKCLELFRAAERS
jgi:hypothetical protein